MSAYFDLDCVVLDLAARYADVVDWEVLSVYPKIYRAYSPLFTAYTDRAFPGITDSFPPLVLWEGVLRALV